MATSTTSRKLFTTWFRCAVDGHDHAVEDEAFAAGRARGAGEYRAVCGHTVTASAAILPNGPRCSRCHAVLDAQHERNTPRVDQHSGRPGIARRLLARVLPTPAGPARRPRPEFDPGGSELPTPSALAPTGSHGTEADQWPTA